MADKKQITVIWHDRDLKAPSMHCVLLEEDDVGITVEADDGIVAFIPHTSYRFHYSRSGKENAKKT